MTADIVTRLRGEAAVRHWPIIMREAASKIERLREDAEQMRALLAECEAMACGIVSGDGLLTRIRAAINLQPERESR